MEGEQRGVKQKEGEYFFFFFFVENTKYFNTDTHTQGERGECFKETNNGIYPKGPRKESKLPYLDVF